MAREIDIIGVRSLVVALTAALFTGMVLALQTAVNMARFGAENYVGPVVALSILRELGPVLTAILVGGKVASGITAELGSMKVTEQIDALRALGVNYVKKLIVPRIIAALIVFPLVTDPRRRHRPRGRHARSLCSTATSMRISTGTPSPTGWCSRTSSPASARAWSSAASSP